MMSNSVVNSKINTNSYNFYPDFFILIDLLFLLAVNIPNLSIRQNNYIFLALEFLIVFYILIKGISIKILKKITPVVIYALYTIFATLIYVGFDTRVITAIITGVKYILFFYSFIYLTTKYNISFILKKMSKFLLFICLILAITVWGTNAQGFGGVNNLRYYLIGDKFTISYIHMLAACLLFASTYKKNYSFIYFTLFCAYNMVIIYKIDCTTGLVGTIAIFLFGLLFKYTKKIKKILCNPIFYIIILLVASYSLIGSNILLDNDYISELFLKFSHTNELLSGRLKMYKLCLEYIGERPIFGYGINCNIVEDVLGDGNPQNGILKILLDFGALGLILFIFLLFYSLKLRSKKENLTCILVFLYGMGICAMVEICLAGLFFFALAAYYALSNYGVLNE